MPADGQDFVNGAITDDFAHHAFRKIAQSLFRFTRAEEIALRVCDSVLHDPWNEGGVEVAGDHRLGVLGLLIALELVGRALSRETELEFQEPLGGNDQDFIDIRNGISQARPFSGVIGAEAEFYADGICRNGNKPGEQLDAVSPRSR